MRLQRFIQQTLLVSGLIVSVSSTAQLVGGSVFLQGRYVEAGICDIGDFGAASPPSGYHPHTTSSGGGALGFVADPDMDGWTTGTPAYDGDYFTPGYPFEGWNIQVGSRRATAHSCMSFGGDTGLVGNNISHALVGSELVGVWEGSFDSVTIRQETTLDTNALFFTMKITLINNSSVPVDDIYYFRSVDPDNDRSWGGYFPTRNTIEYQLPNPLDATVVSAKGTADTTVYLSLGTADTNARCIVYNSWPISASVDMATIYSGTLPGTYAAGSSSIADVAIGLVFRVAHLAPVDSASDSVAYRTTSAIRMRPANQSSFTYFYAFRPDATDSAINYIKIKNAMDTVVDVVTPIDTTGTTYVNSINAANDVKVYPNPAQSVVNVTGLSGTDRIQLYDLMGRELHPNWVVANKSINTFSLQEVPMGNYIILIKDEHGNTKAHVPLRRQ